VELAAGEVIPCRHSSPRHFVKHLVSLLKTRFWVVHKRLQAGVAAANPPGSAAARPSPPRPHVGLHRAEPHGPLQDRLQWLVVAKPHAELREASLYKGLNVFLFPKILFSL
jgi:hypothetical protein